VRKVGFVPVVGQYDFAIEYEKADDFARIVTELHRILRGTRVRYELMTEE